MVVVPLKHAVNKTAMEKCAKKLEEYKDLLDKTTYLEMYSRYLVLDFIKENKEKLDKLPSNMCLELTDRNNNTFYFNITRLAGEDGEKYNISRTTNIVYLYIKAIHEEENI